LREFRGKSERDVIVAGDFRSVEEEKLVDDSCRESGAVECRSGFEENA
jgi:hypothetical protein